MTTVVTPCSFEEEPNGSHQIWIEVSVEIDDAGRHHKAVGIQHASGRFVDAPDRRNPSIANRQIRDKRRHPGTVIDPSILYDQIIHGNSSTAAFLSALDCSVSIDAQNVPNIL
jgi:hypothetical protein